ncbi:MAG: SBBP repeat-containing protein [Bacteroidetes bacterium]|nr:SBBP repeat-containing protein [Bacteroidota bacterium]
MKKLIFFFALFFLSIFSFSQEWEWTKVAGGPAVDKITGIATDLTGNIFVTGYFDSIIAFDSTRLVSAGGTDVFIAKYDADGVLLWAKQVGGQNDDYANAISTDITGNCYITGFFFIQGATTTMGSTTITQAGDADIFVSKFNPSGNLLWVRNGGGKTEDGGFGIATDVSGNSYVCGYFSGTALFGNTKITSVGYSDVFVSKYDAAGNLVWIRTGGGAYQDEAYAISTDVAGNCYLTGYFTGNATFGGTALASAGYFDTDIFLIKYNPSGIMLWAKRAGGTANDIGYGIDVANNGQIFVGGVFYGTKSFGGNMLTRVSGSNGFLAKFESSGKLAWTRGTNGTGLNEYRKVSTDAAGNCYVAAAISQDVLFGSINITSAGGKDACIVKYDQKGSLMWVLQGGGTEDDEGMTISSDQAGNCYVGGEFNTNGEFGRLKFSGWGLQDIFISRIK